MELSRIQCISHKDVTELIGPGQVPSITINWMLADSVQDLHQVSTESVRETHQIS